MMKSPTFTVPRKNPDTDLVAFLATRLRLSRKKAKALIDSRNVYVNQKRVWMARHQLRPGDLIELVESYTAAPETAISVLFEGKEYLVVNKPAGIVANEESSVESLLRKRRSEPLLTSAHRIDRDTTGCLLLARNPEALEAATTLFHDRLITKVYHALVWGRVAAPDRSVKTPIDGARAVTLVRTLDTSRQASHILVKLETGRTHQIRKHMASLGHTVVGDKRYEKTTRRPLPLKVGRQMLHAFRLEFKHPVSGQRIRAEAPLPRDFRRCMKELKLT